MTNDHRNRPVGPIEGTTFLVLTCLAGLVLVPSVMALLAQPLVAVTPWAWTLLVMGEEIVRVMVVTVGRRIRATWPQIIFAVWLPFSILEWATALLSGDAETVGHPGLAALYLVAGGVGHVVLTLYFIRLKAWVAFIAALLSHLAWNTAVLMAFPETRALLLS